MSANNLNNNIITQKVKSLTQICPKCGGKCNLKNDGFFIISECEFNHKLKYSIKEFEKSQIIPVPVEEIFCDICLIKELDNTFSYCIQCEKKLCKSCKEHHIFPKKHSSHKTIDYNLYITKKKYSCKEHNESYISYCSDCKKNLCSQCSTVHDNHNIIDFNLNMKGIKRNLDKCKLLKEKLKSIFDNIIKQIENYFREFNELCEIIEEKSRNIGIIREMQELNNLKSFDLDLINEKFQNIININNNEKDTLKVITSVVQFHEEITNPDYKIIKEEKSNRLDENLSIKKENELNFLPKKSKEKKEDINIIDNNNKKLIAKETIKSKETNKISKKNVLIKRQRRKTNIYEINISYNYNKIIYTKMTSDTYIFQACTLINNISEVYRYDIKKVSFINNINNINNIFDIQKLICADNENNNSSYIENTNIIYESENYFFENNRCENLYDGSCYGNKEINSNEKMGNYIEFLDNNLNKERENENQIEKYQTCKFSSNIESLQKNKNDSNSRFTFGGISTIPSKNKNNEVNSNNDNCTEKALLKQIGEPKKNIQKSSSIIIKLINGELNNNNFNNDKSSKNRKERNNKMSLRKNSKANIKIIRFNIDNINPDFMKILLKRFSINKNIENKFLYIISIISNILSFKSKYCFIDIFRILVNNNILMSYNHSRIDIFSLLEENEFVYVTFLTSCIKIFFNYRGNMVGFSYPYGFIVSNILFKFNIDFLGYLISL